jgi:hypothetical protein
VTLSENQSVLKHYSRARSFLRLKQNDGRRGALRKIAISPAPRIANFCWATLCRICAARDALTCHPAGACNHTELYVFDQERQQYGIVGCAVGGAFAVLIAEELFASGLPPARDHDRQVTPVQVPPYFVVIDRALRDEGTSYHYRAASEYREADAGMTNLAREALSAAAIPVHIGASWTTDAPFRETEEAIAAALGAGISGG